MEQKRDKYDEAIDALMLAPEKIYETWNHPKKHEHGCLFQFMTNDGGRSFDIPGGSSAGCVSLIHSDPSLYTSENNELTEMIKNDERIPNEVNEETTREQLEVFAEYQRKADALFGRK